MLRWLHRRFFRPRSRFDLLAHDLYWSLRGDRLRSEFYRRGPWITRFTLAEREYGGYVPFENDRRLGWFIERFKPCRVLELGSLEGGQTLQLLRAGYKVVALEGRSANAARARWLLEEVAGLPLDLRVANLETIRLCDFGRFDVVLCCGLLYHLPRPWELLDQFAEVAPAVFLSTHYTLEPDTHANGVVGSWYVEGAWEEGLSGLSPRSFLMTREEVLGRLRRNGFARVDVIDDDVENRHGPLISLAAWA